LFCTPFLKGNTDHEYVLESPVYANENENENVVALTAE
jgi:hypothetical protein